MDLHNYHDSESEDSIDIQETAKQMYGWQDDGVIPVKTSPKASGKGPDSPGFLDAHPDQLDSGVDSLSNGYTMTERNRAFEH